MKIKTKPLIYFYVYWKHWGFGKIIRLNGMYLTKGASVYVEGRIRTRKWQGQDGQEKYTTEIIADEMQMLGKRDTAVTNFVETTATNQPKTATIQPYDFDDTEIPF